MTRGNQRDEARLKNAKDAAGKGTKKEGSYLLRKEADSNALADKVDRQHQWSVKTLRSMDQR